MHLDASDALKCTPQTQLHIKYCIKSQSPAPAGLHPNACFIQPEKKMFCTTFYLTEFRAAEGCGEMLSKHNSAITELESIQQLNQE